MLTIIEQTSQRLIIQSKRGMMAVAMTIFVMFSIFTMLMIFGFGVQMLTTNFAWWRLLGYCVWQPLSIALVVVGVMFWNNAMRGLILIFDRDTEQVMIRKPRLLRMQENTYPIYSISRMEMEHIPQAHVFAVYLITKSGEQIAITSASQFEEEPMREIVKVVREFLRG